MKVREFGELWPTDIIMDNKNFQGYFYYTNSAAPFYDENGDNLFTFTK